MITVCFGFFFSFPNYALSRGHRIMISVNICAMNDIDCIEEDKFSVYKETISGLSGKTAKLRN